MKKSIIALWLLCLAPGVMAQQQEKLTLTKVKKGDEPKAVVDAVNKDFPGALTRELSFLPPKLYGEEWFVDLTSDQLDHADFYQVHVKVKQDNADYTAVYDGNGKLLSSRQLLHNVLPFTAIRSLCVSPKSFGCGISSLWQPLHEFFL